MNPLTLLQTNEDAPAPEPATGDPLEGLRDQIDELDGRLVALLAERCRLAEDIGRVKADRGIDTTDPAREARVVRKVAEGARSLGLDAEGVRSVYWRIIELSHRVQLPGG